MKNHRLLLVLALFLGFNFNSIQSHAQFGKLNKLKSKVKTTKKNNKADEEVKKEDKTEIKKEDDIEIKKESSVVTRKRYKDGTPKYDSNNPDDPIYNACSDLKQQLKAAKDGLADSRWPSEYMNREVNFKLQRAAKDIKVLDADAEESKQAYFIEYKKQYAEIENQRKKGFDSFNNSEKLIESLEKWKEKKYSYEYACRTIRELDTTLRYKDYMAFRSKSENDYPNDFNSEDVHNEFKIMDDYFNIEVYNHVNKDMNKKADEQIKMMYAEHGKYQDYQFEPEGYLNEFKELAEYLNFYKRNLIGDVSKITATESKIVNEKDKLEKYINGGEYEAFKVKANKERVDRVRFAKKGMNTTKYNAMVTRTVTNGKVMRIVVVSSQWQIVKNSYGIPEHKWLGVDLAVKRGGKCYLRYGRLTKTYEGGGKYGKTHFLYHDNGPEEMNCKNVFK